MGFNVKDDQNGQSNKKCTALKLPLINSYG